MRDVSRKQRRGDEANEPLQFMSPEQYREKYGRDPVPPDRTAEVWPDSAGWPGWAMPWPPPTVIVVMAEWVCQLPLEPHTSTRAQSQLG